MMHFTILEHTDAPDLAAPEGMAEGGPMVGTIGHPWRKYRGRCLCGKHSEWFSIVQTAEAWRLMHRLANDDD